MALYLPILSLLLLSAVAKSEHPIDFDLPEVVSWRNDEDLTFYRVPEVLDPIHYTVEITPYFEAEPGKDAFSFDGVVDIRVRAVEDGITQIVLQENVRDVIGVTVTDLEGRPVAVNETHQFDRLRNYQFLVINLRDGVTLVRDQEYWIRVVYIGHMNETPLSRGVFRGSYRDSNGNIRWYAACHLQPTHSRQAFPSIDEPGFKSTFKIIINRLNSYVGTYSNMHIEESISMGNRTKDIFITTPRMSAYLVSIHISEEFTVIADNNDDIESYRIIARPEARGQGDYALDVGVKLTAELEQFLGIPYYEMGEQMKNDQLASPDWASGATENWGLVTYRELRLLYEEGETSLLDKKYIGTITAHELAHKWFGNLVTARWWDNVWINEGFASYFEYFSMHEIDRSWQLDDQFNVMYLQSALSADSALNTRALQHEVNTPAQVTNHFSGISYSKGASLLMMLNHYLTPDIFKKALHQYLTDRSYEYALPEHFYAAWETVLENEEVPANLNITNFLRTWVDEPGYPVVTVTVDRDAGVLRLRQERFFISATAPGTDQIWPLPLTYTTSNNPDWDNRRASHLMTAREYTIETPIADDQWVIFNIKQNGIYRVNYDTRNWELIADTLKNSPNDIHYLNRAQIVDDVFALMRSEKISFELGFRILEFLKDETSFFVWYPAITGFNWLRNRLLHIPNALSEFENILYEYLDTVVNELTYDVPSEEPIPTTLNRFFVLAFACNIGHQGCRSDAVEKFTRFLQNNEWVNPNLRRHVFCTGLQESGYPEWQRLYQRRMNSNNQADEVAMLRALGCTSDPDAVQAYLEMVVSDDVRAQDRVNGFTFLYMGHRENSKAALQFIKENTELVRERLIASTWFASVLSNMASYMDDEGLEDMEEWLNENQESIPEYATGISAIQSARTSMEWGTNRWNELLRAARGTGNVVLPTVFLFLPALMAIVLN
ncbi:Membrane alanyl aminopeptidase [Eumeta japonica]|uniref:Aminopeptidase n=1 Tax=Eumeta variegata TaxID=151549 RepID=A0A4C1W529_EUMVA|nr:Membrane alanyl aminopeptidase [Eumeta japonica]